MVINDIIFGELEYDDYYWIKREKEIYNFFGKNYEINIIINGEENDGINPIQRNSYIEYKKDSIRINMLLEEAIYDFYKEECDEYRRMFEDEADLVAPIITSKEELANLIELKNIIIDCTFRNFSNREVIFLFTTTWDDEGIGIRLVNEKVETIGGQSDVL